MTWLQPDEERDPGGRGARWIYLALGYTGLFIATAWFTALDEQAGTGRTITLGLAALAAVWLPLLVPLFPQRTRRPLLVVGYYVVLLAITTTLVARSQTFVAFSWIGYPLGFALFPSRWTVFAVAANALLSFGAQSGLLLRPDAVKSVSPWAFVAAVAVPVIVAGWYAGTESEKRRQLITELTETNRRLAAALEENAGLHAQLLTQAREAGVRDERQRMAREIHDTLAQDLAALFSQLRAADRVEPRSEQWHRHMDQVRELAKQSLTEARRSVQALRPEPLERSHLPDAVAEVARRWSRTSSVPVHVETTGNPRPLITGIEVTLYRVVQEALANVAKHANASRVGITLSYLDDTVLLDIRDDGVGFDVDEHPAEPGADGHGFGLTTMRQRLREVGGTLEIESTPGEGTAIGASVPAIAADGGG